MHRHPVATIHIYADPLNRQRGWLIAGSLRLRVSLGRNGVTHQKREGDGATPAGRWHLMQAFQRAGSGLGRNGLPLRLIRRDDGWCDDVGSGRYNRLIRLPSPLSHEDMWRNDHLYDGVIETDWNRRPAIRGRGSAIFIHLRRDDGGPTAGCIALSRRDLRLLWPRLNRRTLIIVH